ncbi:DUF6192 family protein [Streptomyces phaeochromogenes]
MADLTREDEVAAQVATDLLKRPAVTEHVTPVEKVRVALMEARPAGPHTYQLMAATAPDDLTPITRVRQDGFMFSDDPADRIEYDKRQFRQILGRLTPGDHGHARPAPGPLPRRRMGPARHRPTHRCPTRRRALGATR